MSDEFKEIKVGEWYWRMMGYGGGDSRYCCIMRSKGTKTAAGMMRMFSKSGIGLHSIPVCDEYEAVDECGRSFTVSANDLDANGHIGIGTLEEPRYGHVASIYREDARLLVDTGRYTEEDIKAEFPYAFGDSEEEAEANAGRTEPMTAKQEEILKAAYAANEEKKRKEEEEKDKAFREAVEKVRAKYSYIPCPHTDDKKWLTVGEKSRNVRAVLKHEFPGVKFKVSTRNGSMSDSLTVSYEDGPAKDKVWNVLKGFDEGRFDPYTDYHDTEATPVSVVCGGFDYVFLNRDVSEDTRKYVHDWFMANVDGCDEGHAQRETGKVLEATDFPLGGYEIEGIEYDGHCGHVLKVKAKGEPQKPVPPDGGDRPKAEEGLPDNGDPGKGEAYWKENRAKRGIELYFPAKPSGYIIARLKGNRWRWCRLGFWYNRFNDGTWETARDIVMQYNNSEKEVASVTQP